MTDLSYDVVIVGAGPTGLVIANILGLAGVPVALIERNETTVQEPRAVSIDDESLRTLQALGLIDAVLKDVALDYGAHYFTPAGVRFAEVEPQTREYGFPRRSAFIQPLLEATLRDGLARFPHVTTLFRHTLEAVAEDAAGVSATVSDAVGERRTLRARYLVGADGARSLVRKIIGATLSGATYAQRWLIVDLAETQEAFRQTRVLCDPARPVITLPGPHSVRRYEFMLADGEDEAGATEPAFVRELLAACGPDADSTVIRRQVYAFHARIVDRWQSARVFLAGDAAHLSPPFAGQGMNSGVRDAHNLGWKLAAVCTGGLGPKLLDTYQQERAPHAAALIKLSINIGRVMMPTSRVQAAVVQTAFRLARLVPSVHAYFAQMKYKPKPFYREGFVAGDDSLGIVGRMLPQPGLETATGRVKLDDLVGQGFALVAYGEDAEATAMRLRQSAGTQACVTVAVLPGAFNAKGTATDADVIVGRDRDNTLRPFMPSGACVFVRPDRYVAAAAKTPDALVAMMRDLHGRFVPPA